MRPERRTLGFCATCSGLRRILRSFQSWGETWIYWRCQAPKARSFTSLPNTALDYPHSTPLNQPYFAPKVKIKISNWNCCWIRWGLETKVFLKTHHPVFPIHTQKNFAWWMRAEGKYQAVVFSLLDFFPLEIFQIPEILIFSINKWGRFSDYEYLFLKK